MLQALQGPINPYGGTRTRHTVAPSWQEQVAIWCGRLYLVGAIISLVAVVVRHLEGYYIASDLLSLVNVPSEPSVFAVCVLFVVVGGLRRRLRAAHTVVLALSIVNVLSYASLLLASINEPGSLAARVQVHGFLHEYLLFRDSIAFNSVALGFSVITLLLLAKARAAFTARLAIGSYRSALAILIGGLLASSAATFALTAAFPRTLSGPRQLIWWSLRSAVGVSTPPDTPGFAGHVGHDWIYALSGLISTAAFVFAALVLWRSGRGSHAQDAEDELAVRQLLLMHGEDDSLGYFATRRDKSVIFSQDGRAALTFRVEGAVSVASADPIGQKSAWSAVIDAWLAQCRAHGQYAAVLSSSKAGTAAYVRAGLRAFPLGDEAILDVDTFSLNGRRMRPVRQAVSRITRAGYTYQVCRHADLDSDELAEISRLAEEWRGNQTERGFSMALSRIGDPADGRCLLITARDRDGRIRGFLSFVPWGIRGVSLDLMRRDRDAENGLNEYLVASLIEAAPEYGVRRISLNFAVFRSVFDGAEQVGAGPVTRMSDTLLSFASRFYQLETLFRSNDKYQPTWVPRLLCYDPALTVARAGIAMGIAEGFLPRMGPRILVGPRPLEVQPPRLEPDFVARVHALERDLLVPVPPETTLNDQQQVRRRKLEAMERTGRHAYPVQVPRSTPIQQVLCEFPDLPADHVTAQQVTVCGRVRALRDFGGVAFAVLEQHGDRLQVIATLAGTPDEEFHSWRHFTDLGDQVCVSGHIATSRHGERSILMESWIMAAKCLTPLPTLHASLSDEVRARARSLELVVDQGARVLLERRSVGMRALRDSMQDEGFLEVETPMLQLVHGGATARPFRTHINAYDTDLYLRIAPELYLKRLAVGGMSRIFEIGRNFRNEGVDASHNPEFTSMEAYAVHADYDSMRELTRRVLLRVATAMHGRPVAQRPDGEEVDLSAPWPVMTVHEAVSRATGVTVTPCSTPEAVAAVCRSHDIDVHQGAAAGEMVCELYDALVEKQTVFPTFYTDFPIETSPLTRPHRSIAGLAERWDLVAFGSEIGTAYSELTDPIDQRERLVRQSIMAAAGDLEAMQLDESFLEALELGLPPTGGLGIGVDRMIMMLTGVPIRSTLTFPFVRPRG